MTPVLQQDGTLQYDILVRFSNGDEQVYRTQELLSIFNEDRICSRGTRVWKAIRVENGHEIGEPVALKDSWIDGRRAREGCTIANIKQSAARCGESESIDAALLTVVIHGDVAVEGLQDRTRAFPRDTPLDSHTKDPTDSPPRNNNPSLGEVPRDSPYQVHYRIVFKEVCESLADKKSISNVFKALFDTCEGK